MKHLSKFLVHGNNILVFHEKKSYFDNFGSVNSFSVTSAGIFPNLIELILEFEPENLKTLVKNAPGNEQYRAKTAQNEAIQVFAEYIKEKIVSEVKESMYFTILAEEANDISNKEQISLVLRYKNKKGEISESFVSFLHCKEATSGEALVKLIVDAVYDLGMELGLKPVEM